MGLFLLKYLRSSMGSEEFYHPQPPLSSPDLFLILEVLIVNLPLTESSCFLILLTQHITPRLREKLFV